MTRTLQPGSPASSVAPAIDDFFDSASPDLVTTTIEPGNVILVDDSSSVLGGWFYRGQESPPAEVPEPGSLALMGLGLAGMGFIRRRKKL